MAMVRMATNNDLTQLNSKHNEISEKLDQISETLSAVGKKIKSVKTDENGAVRQGDLMKLIMEITQPTRQAGFLLQTQKTRIEEAKKELSAFDTMPLYDKRLTVLNEQLTVLTDTQKSIMEFIATRTKSLKEQCEQALNNSQKRLGVKN